MNAPVAIDYKALALRDPRSVPLEEIDVSNPYLYQEDTWGGFFARLRREDPVHFVNSPMYGPYWSVTRYRDIMTVDTSHQVYSSDASMGGIALRDVPFEFRKESFIAMDPPRHDEQRKIVSPIVAPMNLAKLAGTIRERAGRILDGLPRGEVFDWVDLVSVELTTQMLATLFDFPFEERRTLTYWSNVASVNTRAGTEIDSEAKRDVVLRQMLEYMTGLWRTRAQEPPRPDLISMLAHGEATRDLPSRPQEFMGNLLLLIVGGNDTTRNSISGGLLALNRFPGEYAKLRENPGLIPKMVPEIIRFQSPVVHMRRTAMQDTELGGKTIRGREGRHVVHLRQPRQRGDRGRRQLHHRPRASPAASVVWVRYPSLRRQPAGRDATDDTVGGNPEALPGDRGGGGTETVVLQPDPRDHGDEGAHSRVRGGGGVIAALIHPK